MACLKILQRAIGAWHLRTFPDVPNPIGKVREEFGEFLDKPSKEEAADCLITLLAWCDRHGHDLDSAVREKFERVRNRDQRGRDVERGHLQAEPARTLEEPLPNIYRSITAEVEMVNRSGVVYARTWNARSERLAWRLLGKAVEIDPVAASEDVRGEAHAYYLTCLRHCIDGLKTSRHRCEWQSVGIRRRIEELLVEADEAEAREIADLSTLPKSEVVNA